MITRSARSVSMIRARDKGNGGCASGDRLLRYSLPQTSYPLLAPIEAFHPRLLANGRRFHYALEPACTRPGRIIKNPLPVA
jgi:hypothetical protein